MCHYVSMSTALLIPTQQQGAIVATSPEELDGYSSRGWCRCECVLFAIASELLAASQSQSEEQAADALELRIYAASASGALTHLPRTGWSAALPGDSGALSVEADREHIEAMLALAFDGTGRTKIRRACKAAQKQKVRKVEGGRVALGASRLGDQHMEAFTARLIAGDLDAVQSIDLSHNQLSDAGVATLAKALKAHPLRKLEELSLQGNHQVTADGMRTIAEVVGTTCRVNKLDLIV